VALQSTDSLTSLQLKRQIINTIICSGIFNPCAGSVYLYRAGSDVYCTDLDASGAGIAERTLRAVRTLEKVKDRGVNTINSLK